MEKSIMESSDGEKFTVTLLPRENGNDITIKPYSELHDSDIFEGGESRHSESTETKLHKIAIMARNAKDQDMDMTYLDDLSSLRMSAHSKSRKVKGLIAALIFILIVTIVIVFIVVFNKGSDTPTPVPVVPTPLDKQNFIQLLSTNPKEFFDSL